MCFHGAIERDYPMSVAFLYVQSFGANVSFQIIEIRDISNTTNTFTAKLTYVSKM